MKPQAIQQEIKLLEEKKAMLKKRGNKLALTTVVCFLTFIFIPVALITLIASILNASKIKKINGQIEGFERDLRLERV